MITRRDAFRLAVTAGSLRILGAQGTQSVPANVLYYGRQDPLPEVISLQAGPVSAIFDIETASLRYVRAGSDEIIRAIYAALRDSDWGTVEPKLHGLKVTTGERGFELTFDVDCVRAPSYNFSWMGRITGDTAGTIRFSFDGQARSTFLRNRLGFAVLHPTRGVAGKAARVRKSGNVTENGTFPDLISPNQPFFEMRSVAHEVRPGLEAEVRFEGEVFEMEDHRNWTDASYKTYCTPLALPYPVEVKQGTKVSQAIEIRLKGELPAAPRRSRMTAAPVAVKVSLDQSHPIPRIGLGSAYHGQVPGAAEIARLKALAPAHLRADCKFAGEWKAGLGRAVAEAAALGVPIELAAHLPESAGGAAEELAAAIRESKARLAGVLLYRAEGKAADEAWLGPLKAAFGGTPVAVGTDDGFVQVNRNRPQGASFDAVCYSINPQVHAIDNMTMVENLAAQADTVRTAKSFSGGKPVWVSPVTLKMRYNPNARGPAAEIPEGTLPPNADARQMSLFGAGWTLGSLKYLSESEAERVTYFETTGWRGVMETAKGSGLRDKFPSVAGGVFPLYHVLADVAAFAGKGKVARSESSEPLRLSSLVLRMGPKWRILLANHTHEACPFTLEGISLDRPALTRRMNADTAMAAMSRPEAFRKPGTRGVAPRVLEPYEVLTLDLG